MRNTLNEGFDKLFESVCKEDLDSDIAMYQKWVDDDIAKYGKISGRTRVALDKKGLTLQRDPEEGNFVVVKKSDDSIELADFGVEQELPSKDDSKMLKARQSIVSALAEAGRDKILQIAYDFDTCSALPDKEPSELSTPVLIDGVVNLFFETMDAEEIYNTLANYGINASIRAPLDAFPIPQGVPSESCENPAQCGKEPIKESFYSTDEVLEIVSPKVKARLQRIIDTQKQKYGNDMEIEVSISSPYKARLNYGEGGADYVKGDDGKWSHDYGYITISPSLANAILSDVCSATGACDESKKCEAVNDGNPTKIFKVSYIETLQYDESIEAKSEKDAIAEFKRMQEEGEIDYSDGVLVDSKYEAKVSDLVYEDKGEKK